MLENLICNKCLINQSIENFYQDKTYTNGLKPTCKNCYNKATRKNYKENGGKERCLKLWREKFKNEEYKESQREYDRKYNKTLIGRIKNWKASAKRRHIGWNLTNEYISQMPLVCFYTGETLTFETHQQNTISIERIDSSKGYEVGNVVFCCADINLMKQSFPVSHFIEMCEKVVNHCHGPIVYLDELNAKG